MKQIILLGLTGSFDPQLVAEIVQLIAAKKLQVQHASNRYDGDLHIYTGTPDDIKAALAECGSACVGIQMSDVPQPDGTEALTLSQVNGNVLLALEYLVKLDKSQAPKPPKETKQPKPPVAAKKEKGTGVETEAADLVIEEAQPVALLGSEGRIAVLPSDLPPGTPAVDLEKEGLPTEVVPPGTTEG